MIIQVPCSQDQMDIIENHALNDGEMGMDRDEKIWIVNHVRAKYRNAKIIRAHLNIPDGLWEVEISLD